MIKKIEEPDWNEMTGNSLLQSERRSLMYWFAENIQPINEALDKAVKVEGRIYDNALLFGKGEHGIGAVNKQALLINIQEIKQETCADVLKEWLEAYDHIPEDFENTDLHKLYKRAKRALGLEVESNI